MASASCKNNIIHTPMDIKINVNQSFSKYVLENLQKNSENIGQIDSHTGKSETFAELLKRSISLAQALKLKGVTTEDIVAICCQNNMDYIVVMIASIFIGARFCIFDSSAPKHEIIHCLKITTPVIMFCEYENEDFIKCSIKESTIKCDIVSFKTDKFILMENFVHKSDEEFEIDTARKLNDTGCITFTSGTSGLTKGAELTYNGFYHYILNEKRRWPLPEHHMIFTLPYWISNIYFCLLSVLNGHTRVIYKQFELKTVVKNIQDYKVNRTFFNQHVMNELIKYPQFCNYDTSSLQYVSFGGSKIGSNQIEEIKKLFPHTKFVHAYGMTEVGRVCISEPELIIDEMKNISVGTLLPGYYCKVVDINTNETIGPYQKGELRIKFAGAMNGYFHQPDVTAAAFDDDGYFKTGDIVYYDDNHNFFVVDRLKEIFKYKGYHISPVVIEDALLLHPDVKDCAIIPTPHEHDGEWPMAIIQLTENAKATEQDFIQHIKECLSDFYQLRGGVKFLNSIPRTTTGKLKRQYLKELILNQN